MAYPILLTIHLFAAIFFIGVVFFEVLMLEPIRSKVSREGMRQIEGAIGERARKIMPWVLATLFGAGIGMVWLAYLPVLANPSGSKFGIMLWIKIVLAFSVLCHFLVAVTLMRKGKLRSRGSRIIHISVFCHMLAIVILAKWMFHAG
ncbi:hypothetical protein [Diaphorobacter ruginosibacter]|jgi:Uncharacterized protein conserved in bacteria|uniref:CopD family copper resistance protein n=1 Tax=Diaphorobacter ruginosibacter TaxID=1715720 RepID=UPI0033428E38